MMGKLQYGRAVLTNPKRKRILIASDTIDLTGLVEKKTGKEA